MPKSPVDNRSTGTTAMKSEIDSAVNFLSSILRSGGKVGLSSDQLLAFRRCLEATLVTRYHDHWFPDRPQRGSAYRCVRIVNSKLDRLLASAAVAAGVPEPLLERLLPTELTLWVDPDEVSNSSTYAHSHMSHTHSRLVHVYIALTQTGSQKRLQQLCQLSVSMTDFFIGLSFSSLQSVCWSDLSAENRPLGQRITPEHACHLSPCDKAVHDIKRRDYLVHLGFATVV